jgi:hypothetical protein
MIRPLDGLRCLNCGRFLHHTVHLCIPADGSRTEKFFCDWDCVAKLRKKQLEAMRDMLIIGGSR